MPSTITVENYTEEILVRVYAANLVILCMSRPGAYMERFADPQPSVEFVLGFPMIESIAGKYCVGFRSESIEQTASKTFIKDCFARELS